MLYGPYVTVRVNDYPCTAMVDSGNLWRTVLSKKFADRIGLTQDQLRPISVTHLGTAKEGAAMRVLGETKKPVTLRMGGVALSFRLRPLVVDGLSMDMNISGPFLQQQGIDHLHSQQCLSVKGKKVPLRAADGQLNHIDQTSCPVYLLKDVKIKPKRVMEVPALVPAVASGVMPYGDGIWKDDEAATQKAQLASFGWQLTGCDPYGLMSIPIVNTSGKVALVTKGTQWGTFQLTTRDPEKEREVQLQGEQKQEQNSEKWTDAQKKEWLTKEFKLLSRPRLRTRENVNQALDVLLKHWSVFSTDGNFGRTSLVEHELHLSNDSPIKCKYRPLCPSLEDSLRRQLDIWLKHDVIEESCSPWSFALVAAPKKNTTTLRWCVDYRLLNQRTIKDAMPLPSIEDNLSRLAGSDTFSGIDGMGAFHVVPMRKKDREKTAFATPWGAFHFKRMPFGLSNGPATYTRLVNAALRDVPPTVALPYLDDTIVHSKGLQKHLQGLDLVLAGHAKAGLKLQPSKCNLFQDSVDYLGHRVSEEGISPMTCYTDIIRNWPLPQNKQEARTFIGKVAYYRRFIPNYSKRAACWTDVMARQEGESKKAPLEVTKEMEAAFKDLKGCLLRAPILAYPDFNSKEPFILDTDWSEGNRCVGGVLSQKQGGKERVICYGAKKKPASQAKYAPTKGEMSAVIHFLEAWRYYLLFRRFVLRTDHQALKWINSLTNPSGMEARWREVLADYDFVVEYRPGPKHGNADALSRAPHADPPDPEEDTFFLVSAIRQLGKDVALPTLPQEWQGCQSRDLELKNVYQWALQGTWPSAQEQKILPPAERYYCTQADRVFVDKDGVLRVRGKDDQASADPLPCIPFTLQDVLARRAHLTSGHRGGKGTVEVLSRMGHFPGMRKEAERAVKECSSCQRSDGPPKGLDRGQGPILGSYPFQRIALDFVGPLPPSQRGNTWLLTVKDTFSRWLEAFPLQAATAAATVRILEKDIFPRFGVPGSIHTDQGAQFTSHLVRQVAALLDIKLTTTPAYHPQSNPVERSHRDLNRALKCITKDYQTDWEEALPQALLSTRMAINRHTGLSPFQLLFGRDPPLPVDLLELPPQPLERKDALPEVRQIENRIRAVQEFARNNLRQVTQRQKQEYTGKGNHFVVGDLVWLFTPPYTQGRGSRKFASGWTGPWTVDKIINKAMVRLLPDENWPVRVKPEVATDRLKPYYTPRADPSLFKGQEGIDYGMATDPMVAHYENGPEERRYPPLTHHGDDDDDWVVVHDHPAAPPPAPIPGPAGGPRPAPPIRAPPAAAPPAHRVGEPPAHPPGPRVRNALRRPLPPPAPVARAVRHARQEGEQRRQAADEEGARLDDLLLDQYYRPRNERDGEADDEGGSDQLSTADEGTL